MIPPIRSLGLAIRDLFRPKPDPWADVFEPAPEPEPEPQKREKKMTYFLPISKRKIRAVIVHCTATRPSMPVTREWLDEEHRRRGFKTAPGDPVHIGYHAVITRDGGWFKGRSIDRQGAHAKTNGWNKGTIGISLAGGIGQHTNRPEANFTKAQMRTLRRFIDQFYDQYGTRLLVIGHHDTGSNKACPCFDVLRWLITGEVVFTDRRTWDGTWPEGDDDDFWRSV